MKPYYFSAIPNAAVLHVAARSASVQQRAAHAQHDSDNHEKTATNYAHPDFEQFHQINPSRFQTILLYRGRHRNQRLLAILLLHCDFAIKLRKTMQCNSVSDCE